MKRTTAILLTGAILLTMGVILVGCGGKVAATVNGVPIYSNRIDDQIASLKTRHADIFKGAKGAEMEKVFRKQALDGLVRDELIKQEAERLKVVLSDKEIDDRFNQMKKMFSSQKQFEDALKKQGWTEDQFRENMKSLLLSQKMMQRVASKIKVSEAEMRAYFKKNKDQFKEEEQIKLARIIVKTKSQADKIKSRLDGGASFAALAKKNSTDVMSKNAGGELGWRSRTQMFPEIVNIIFTMKVGQISDPVKMSLGWEIVKVEGKKAAGTRTYKQAKDQVKQRLIAQKQGEAYQKWLQDLEKKAKITRSS